MGKQCKDILIISLVTCLFLLSGIHCYPKGAPSSVCKTGLPLHKENGIVYEPQHTPSPYQISANVSEFRPGDVVTVTISSDQGLGFRGMFLQMRPVINGTLEHVGLRDKPVGRFHNFDSNVKPLTCDVSLESVTHKDRYVKYQQTLYWKTPLLMKTDIFVRATILTNFSTFWTNVESPTVRLITGNTLPAEGLETPWLKEIIKNAAAEGDKEATRNLARARFEKGFQGVLDPNGFIMVHYVLDLLPFEESYPGNSLVETTVKMTPPNNSSSDIIGTTTVAEEAASIAKSEATKPKTEESTATTVLPDETMSSSNMNTSSKGGAPKVSLTNGVNKTIHESVRTIETDKTNKLHYEALVKALLRGDNSVVDELNIIVREDDNTLVIDDNSLL